MKFDELDKKMRVFETSHDHCALPELYLVARIDGRSFTRLTKEEHSFEAPFDERFRDMMVETVEHLMSVGLRIVFGYTQSDEISLLIDRTEVAFSRKLRKYNSVLAGEASGKFSVLLGTPAAFDCRISQLPTVALVRDYFRWRNEDAHRNALNAHSYWTLRREGADAGTATRQLSGLSVSEKNELLFSRGIQFNDLPNWQKRGVGLYWEDFEKEAVNPLTSEKTMAVRRRVRRDYDLPMREEYSSFIEDLASQG